MKPRADYTLYLVTNRAMAGARSLVEVVAQAVEGGVTVVQIREKSAPASEFLKLARALKQRLDACGVPLIVNDRVDIAMACGAAGVHVGQDDIPCVDARALAGDTMVIGVSVGTPEEAVSAERDGADYLGVSPIFLTPTKTDTAAATGLDGLTAIRRATRLPLVAIGGLSAANAGDVIRAGADGIAVVSAIMAAADPREAARRLRSAIDCARKRS